jgi:eukaryotic-like serine/threonine-protein kinase
LRRNTRRQGQTKKALAAYKYMSREGNHKDVEERIRRLTAAVRTSSGVEKDGSAAILLKDSDPETRKRIGRYEIIEELGKGGMGLVYKALDPRINRLLVVKTICFSDEFEEDVVHEIKERFFREAEIAGQLSHPSIVTIYDVGEVGDLTYIVMEFLEGDDLQRYISKKRLLPLRMVINVVAGVADALEFAHRSNVIHRDIKPGNIMLLKSGGIKVTDFGIAKAMSSSRTKTGVIMGTPNYMSPEQIMGRTIDPRSDIFSLGVVFFQLLTGETPFNGDDMGSLLHQITVVKHPSPRIYNSKIPRVCEQIIDKALEKDPKRRFRSAGEMSRYLKLVASKMDHLSKGKEE